MPLLTHKFDVKQYHRMGETGILNPEYHLELIEGEVVVMSPIGLKHMVTINRLNRFLGKRVGDRGILSIQNPIRLNDYSEPQPDVVILRLQDDMYAGKFPEAEDVLLLIEVADSSLKSDREVKLPLYAKHQIPDVWIANLESDVLEIYRQPENGIFSQKIVISQKDKQFLPLAFSDLFLTLSDIYG